MTTETLNLNIKKIVSELTLDEKISMVHGAGLFKSGEVKRLGIPSLKMSDGPMGVRAEWENDQWVPVGNSDDYVTYCPSNSAIAATWNLELAHDAGYVLGNEARGRGKDIILGPGINIKRVPANGRNFEYMSEDPFLVKKLVVPLIKGIQESDVAACVKHFALNSQETDRLWVNVEIDERALREIYLPGFEAATKEAGSYSLMGAYNLFRGEHCCHSNKLLNDILRGEWNYDGCVVSDWGGVHNTKEAAESGLDIEMSVTSNFDEYFMANPLKAAVKNGDIEEVLLDKKIENIIRMMIRINILDASCEKMQDGTLMRGKRIAGTYNTAEHRQACLDTARESMVLLKNEDNILPIDADKLEKLLVIGDNAEKTHANGGGSAEIKALYEISPLLGLKSQLGGNCEVTFARGYYATPKEEAEKNWQEESLNDDFAKSEIAQARQNESKEIIEKRKKLRHEAVSLAKDFDHVIIVGGLNHDYDVEGFDRDNIELPYEQDELISEVLAVNPNAVIVMMAGNAVSMGKWKDQAKAIIWNYYAGLETGNALAEIILGKVNPSGKLPETMPYKMEDCGAVALGEYPGRPLTDEDKTRMDAHSTETYKDSIWVGYRYYEKYNVPVQFCFGHGLSYTTFEYSNMNVSVENIGESVVGNVTFDITNTGSVTGREIPQLYISDTECTVERPNKELKGFEKIELKPGETKRIEIPFDENALSFFDVNTKQFIWEPGEFVISVGQSLENIVLQEKIVL